MHTLLLRLCGPMQSWGVQSRFTVRDTGLEPSKSGVVGLLCAALGIDRADDAALQPLATLRMGIRADREGMLKMDYHTAQNVLKAGGGIKPTEVSRRYYLADACFLAGLEGEDKDLPLLQRLHAALKNPVWPLFLGRKAFVPAESPYLPDGLRLNTDLETALKTYPPLTTRPSSRQARLVLEDSDGYLVRPDQPLSFSQRRFVPRRLTSHFMAWPAPPVENLQSAIENPEVP
ncbi:MAG: type I-E CRISPR-associated protein Cas5/CasD [Chloroflexi bacterium]|nr:type I-E CRISPR-associated protein Cas5/CasD [Chloroflexota bacterium]